MAGANFRLTFEEMSSLAGTVNSMGGDVRNYFKAAYTRLQNMSADWYGTRYNELMRSFNGELRNLVNQMIDLTEHIIPVEIEKIRNNYARVNGDALVNRIADVKPEQISEIPMSETASLHFDDAKVEEAKKEVLNNFMNADERVGDIKSSINSMSSWEGEASETFNRKINELQASINKAIEEIKTQFNSAMEAASKDYNLAENKNSNKGE